jgi:hypothetical protein
MRIEIAVIALTLWTLSAALAIVWIHVATRDDE